MWKRSVDKLFHGGFQSCIRKSKGIQINQLLGVQAPAGETEWHTMKQHCTPLQFLWHLACYTKRIGNLSRVIEHRLMASQFMLRSPVHLKQTPNCRCAVFDVSTQFGQGADNGVNAHTGNLECVQITSKLKAECVFMRVMISHWAGTVFKSHEFLQEMGCSKRDDCLEAEIMFCTTGDLTAKWLQ